MFHTSPRPPGSGVPVVGNNARVEAVDIDGQINIVGQAETASNRSSRCDRRCPVPNNIFVGRPSFCNACFITRDRSDADLNRWNSQVLDHPSPLSMRANEACRHIRPEGRHEHRSAAHSRFVVFLVMGPDDGSRNGMFAAEHADEFVRVEQLFAFDDKERPSSGRAWTAA